MKYDVRICRCGKIHFIDSDAILKALEDEANLVVICSHCGESFVIGADKYSEPDELGDMVPCYNMYTGHLDGDYCIDMSDFVEWAGDRKKLISQIIYSRGVSIPMMSGQCANMYSAGRFSDMWYPDLYRIDRSNVTPEEVHEFIENYHRDRYTVNMNCLLRSLSDDQAECLSHYLIPQFNWSGTKWATQYNSK